MNKHIWSKFNGVTSLEFSVRIEYNEGVNDDPEPNSMNSLIRLFDKKDGIFR